MQLDGATVRMLGLQKDILQLTYPDAALAAEAFRSAGLKAAEQLGVIHVLSAGGEAEEISENRSNLR